MKIGFFEEFPTKENLDKISLIDFESSLIIAAPSVTDFFKIMVRIKKYKNRNIREVIFWPVLSVEEGYWLSAFSSPDALIRITKELRQIKEPLAVMWDAEVPFYLGFRWKYVLNYLFYYFKNRKTILDFFRDAKEMGIKILTSEYPLESSLFRKILSNLFLVSFDPKVFGNMKIVMFYTSLFKGHPKIEAFLERQLKVGKEAYKENFLAGAGLINPGVFGNEQVLAPQELERDLRIMESCKINHVFIYGLGGLNKKYIDAIKKYKNF